jgi:hypothetical protein
MRIEAGEGDLVRRIGDDQAQVGYSGGGMIERSADTVCDPHRTQGGDGKCRLSGLPSKPVAIVCQWFGLKTTVTFSWFGPQNQGRGFGDLCLKITATVSWFGSQNKVGGGLSVCATKQMSR